MIELMTQEPYFQLKDANLITIGKRADRQKCSDASFDEQYNYFRKCFLAEHSTIENLTFRVFCDESRGDVNNQIVRATKGHPRFQVQSSRPDWNNGAPRKPSNETFVYFNSVWSPLSWMQMCRQRLCKNAMKETRMWVHSVLLDMKDSGDPFFVALYRCCVPQCVYRGNVCYELKPCGMFRSGL